MFENKNKLVVITGGTKGIGRAIAERFANDGFTLALCSRSIEDLSETKRSIESSFNNSVYVFGADVSIKDDVNRFLDFIKKIEIPIEVLINNAGQFIPGTVHEEDDGILEQQIEGNLYSAYRMSRGLIPDMKKAKKGHIFNICSTASIMAYSNGGSYCISKFAMYGMNKVLREEMKNFGIKVTAVLPGATFTSSWEGVDLPKERFMPAEDIATMVFAAYQLSDRSVVEDLIIRPQLGDI